ncbi:MAG: glycosyltransferase family 9 protein [Bacteroidia bacterium]|nr:glycosyltransferase family 9 protein [Bacteroidia bacterium]
MKGIKNILISRADSIGDVVLTLPMAGVLKKLFPQSTIFFLGKNYTRDVIAMSKHVDEFISWDDLSSKNISEQIEELKNKKIDCMVHVFPKKEIALLGKKAQIPVRIGTTNRMYHWFSCNKLIKLSRKNSDLHEAQLNLKLLVPLGANENYSLKEIEEFYGFEKLMPPEEKFSSHLSKEKKNIILHPRSKGSAREWGLENFSKLISALPKDKFNIFISGTAEEGKDLGSLFKEHSHLTDLTGKLSLSQFISFIAQADILVAASTGPLHIAAALQKKAIGLFVPMRPIHPGRWAPIGKNAKVVVINKNCDGCKVAAECACIKEISVEMVLKAINE